MPWALNTEGKIHLATFLPIGKESRQTTHEINCGI